MWTMSSNERDKDLKVLSHAIVDALARNDDVMSMLSDLKERNVIDSSTLLGLALKINDLLEISGTAFTNESLRADSDDNEEVSLTKPTDVARKPVQAVSENLESKTVGMIDGRKLSKNEVAFQEWVNGQFDEKGWLSSSGLIW